MCCATIGILLSLHLLCKSIRIHHFLREITMILLLWMIGSVSGCWNSTQIIDFLLGSEPEYSLGDPSEEAAEYWAGKVDKDGSCLEPLFYTYSCDPLKWSNEGRNATLFTCAEDDEGVPEVCIDAALVCTGSYECPNGADEVPGGMDCSEYECPYPELGGLKCDHANAEWETKLCLHSFGICSGTVDCVGGEDEEQCEDITHNNISFG